MTTQGIVYLAGMPPAFLAGVIAGEWERRTSLDIATRDAILVPAALGLLVALLWPLALGAAVFVGIGLAARLVASRMIDMALRPPRDGCPAHPVVGRAICSPEWADRCSPDCWTRIPRRDLRSSSQGEQW